MKAIEVEYEIKRDFKIPAKKGPGRKRVYPFDTMEVGDSFEIDLDKRSAVSSNAYTFGKRNNKEFSVVRDGDRCRVCRVA